MVLLLDVDLTDGTIECCLGVFSGGIVAGPLSIPCEECGKIQQRYPSGLKNRKYGTFCDRHCLGKFRSRVLVGDYAAHWKSGYKKCRDYVRVPASWHPRKDKKGYCYLHRVIVESKIGRFLEEDEIVHHKDGNPLNNHWDNLEHMTQADHAREHLTKDRRDKYGKIKKLKD